MGDFSTRLRFTGLSGIDTETMVRSLMQAESYKYNRLKASTQLLSWKQEAYRGVSDKLQSFKSSYFDIIKPGNLRTAASFTTTAATAKVNGLATTLASVSTSSNTLLGRYTLEINKIATKDSYQSAERLGTVQSSLGAGDLLDGLQAGADFMVQVNGGRIETISLTAQDISDIDAKRSISDTEAVKELASVLNKKINNVYGGGKASFQVDDAGTLRFQAETGNNARLMSGSGAGSDNLLSALGMTNLPNGGQANLNLGGSLKNMLGVTGSGVITINGSSANASGTPVAYNEDMSVREFMNLINSSGTGVRLSFDDFNQKFKFESEKTGVVNKISFSDDNAAGSVWDKLGISAANYSAASDAEVVLNGVASTQSSNNFTINGLNITLNGVTQPGQDILLEVKTDVAPMVETIKNFIGAYNELIKNLNDTTSQKRAKKDNYNFYEPLTAEQRESMSDKEVESWEAKAKEGLLNRDSILESMTSQMRSMLYESVDLGDGRKISLYEIGITTSSDFRDRGKLIIDEEKLSKALEERIQDITVLFTKESSISPNKGQSSVRRIREGGISERLNDIINNAIGGSESSLVQKAGVNGLNLLSNEMTEKLKDENQRLDDMFKALRKKEEDYYSRFAAMEAALTKANSQMAYLTSQLGGGMQQ